MLVLMPSQIQVLDSIGAKKERSTLVFDDGDDEDEARQRFVLATCSLSSSYYLVSGSRDPREEAESTHEHA